MAETTWGEYTDGEVFVRLNGQQNQLVDKIAEELNGSRPDAVRHCIDREGARRRGGNDTER